jgi:hypothetical protein
MMRSEAGFQPKDTVRRVFRGRVWSVVLKGECGSIRGCPWLMMRSEARALGLLGLRVRVVFDSDVQCCAEE